MPVQPGIELTKKVILERVTQEQIFERYLGIEVDDGISYINPLRPDRRPGCRFYYNSLGKLYFHDFGKFHWDCFAVIQYRFGDRFFDALRRIAHDFSLREVEAQYFEKYAPPIKIREEVKVAVREWTQEDINFWKKGNITLEDLKRANIYALKAFWINGEYYKCWKVDPTYCFYFGNGLYKLYFPNRKEKRFYQNINQVEDDITQGEQQLPETGDILFITKAYKDRTSMINFKLDDLKFGVEAVLSETHLMKPEKIANRKARFRYIFTLFDNDQTGRRLAIKYYKVYGIPYIMFPKTWKKDFFGNVALFGKDRMQEIINLWKIQKLNKFIQNIKEQ